MANGKDAEQRIDAASVDVLVEETRDLLASEDRRADSLHTRGNGLVGFVGIIAALLGFLGKGLAGYGGIKMAAAILAVVALGLLLIALGLVVGGVLMPSAGSTVATLEVEKFPTYEFIREKPVMIQGRRLKGLVLLLKSERDRNRSKARFLWFAYVAMSLGIASAAASAAILSLEGHLYG